MECLDWLLDLEVDDVVMVRECTLEDCHIHVFEHNRMLGRDGMLYLLYLLLIFCQFHPE